MIVTGLVSFVFFIKKYGHKLDIHQYINAVELGTLILINLEKVSERQTAMVQQATLFVKGIVPTPYAIASRL